MVALCDNRAPTNGRGENSTLSVKRWLCGFSLCLCSSWIFASDTWKVRPLAPARNLLFFQKPCSSEDRCGSFLFLLPRYTIHREAGSSCETRCTAFPRWAFRREFVCGACPTDWETLEVQLSDAERTHEACFVMASNGKGYLIGGRGDKNTSEFDPSTETWTTKNKAPILLHHMQCVAAEDLIWIVTAWTGSYPFEENVDFIYVYNFADDTWETREGMPENRRRGGAAAVYVEDTREIYVSHGNRGGHGAHAEALGWLDKYNIDTGTWTTNLTDAPNPRDHTGAAVVVMNNGTKRICVGGGRDGGVANFFNAVVLPTDCYDLETGEWETKSDIPVGRAGSAYGTTCDDKLMIAGGEGFGQAFPNVDVFDGETWTALDNLNQGRHGTGLAISCGCNDVFIASGAGGQGGGPLLGTTERYRLNESTAC